MSVALNIRVTLGRALVLALAIGTQSGSGDVGAVTLSVPERAIHSFANAPKVLEIGGFRRISGRAGLTAVMRFPNDCYADSGPLVLVGRTPSERAHAVVLQATAPSGCPDIYRPVNRHVRVLLPRGMAADAVRVLARPVVPEVVRRVEFEPTSAVVDDDNLVFESVPIAPGRLLPAYELTQLSAAQGGQDGYVVTGRVTLAKGCDAHVVRAMAFELSDASGTPPGDVIALTAPARCAQGGQQRDLTVAVASPQPLDGRFVYIVNELEPSVHTFTNPITGNATCQSACAVRLLGARAKAWRGSRRVSATPRPGRTSTPFGRGCRALSRRCSSLM
ncbi:hypothetical protein [Arhodomonas sp. AD133]|uniref:hypothetical protein n=1 Tax=Arhodomonas sp. AD133 TaxID=3415009 RepID=UPI003EBFDF80